MLDSVGSRGVRVSVCGCSLLVCPHCGRGKGFRKAQDLQQRYRRKGVRSVGFFTFTIDDRIIPGTVLQKRDRVHAERLLSRFAEELRRVLGVSAAYFWRMEFGEENGRLHWHMLVDDMAFIDRGALAELQAWCREHMGTMKYEFCDRMERATSYLCKYVAKPGAVPAEILELSRIKFTGTSHGYWEPVERPPANRTGERRKARSIGVRLHACGESTVVMGEELRPDGSIQRRFVEKVAVPMGVLVDLAVVSRVAIVDPALQFGSANNASGKPRWMRLTWEDWNRVRLAAGCSRADADRAPADAGMGGGPLVPSVILGNDLVLSGEDHG